MLGSEIEICRFRVRIERLRVAIAYGDPQLGSASMREVRNLADVLRTTVQALKVRATKSVEAFQGEVAITQANMQKVDSVTKDLRLANKELEDVLGDTGSNFPTIGTSSEVSGSGAPDPNGVQVNSDGKAPVNVTLQGVRQPT